ncbi:MAG: nitrilase-related carbon-nitrogen hydrolase [Wenzhouxiangellaceae bacterium]|nr:nitrilase-related carbon-nitrogen hydrolase [Wenzhouxiangellaceae bacterium]
MTDLTCALLQADTRWGDPEANRAHLAELMDAVGDCGLYVLPETCTTGFLGDTAQLDAEACRADREWFRRQARERGAAVTGSIVDIEDGRIFNRMLFAAPDGTIAHYDKRHLFGYGGEDERYTAGTRRRRIGWNGWRIDLQVCYDVRFPVWCRNDDGFDLQLFVANWPAARVEAWSALLRARAIENQCYVIGLNRSGTDGNDIVYPGRSAVFGPGGETLVELDDAERVTAVKLSLDDLRATRDRFPFLADRDAFRIEVEEE